MKNLYKLTLITILLTTHVMAADGLHIESSWGLSESLNSNVKFNRVNKPDFTVDADWEGRSVIDSWYYAIKFENWKNDTFSGIEWIHHKIYMVNEPPSLLEDFSISDGYNFLFYNRGYRSKKNRIHRYGGGLVLAHMDVTFPDGERFYMKGGLGGSYVSGIGAQYALEKWIYETDRFYYGIEGKVTASYIRPPISTNDNEYAELTNFALHILISLGTKPPKKEASLIQKAEYLLYPTIHHLAPYLVNTK